jgi:hypothetical protein
MAMTTHNVKILIQQRQPDQGSVLETKVPVGGRWFKLSERSAAFGFTQEEFHLMKKHLTDRQICRALGNTIVVDVVEATLGAGLRYVKDARMALSERSYATVPKPLPDALMPDALMRKRKACVRSMKKQTAKRHKLA